MKVSEVLGHLCSMYISQVVAGQAVWHEDLDRAPGLQRFASRMCQLLGDQPYLGAERGSLPFRAGCTKRLGDGDEELACGQLDEGTR